jgi:DNA invertase Pin-like site-specific DNA recombinase
MIYGYALCSTDETKQDINRQIRELKELGATDETIYLEYQSGTKRDRAELNKVLSILKSQDTLLATEVSRITRSTKQLCEIIEMAKERHI